MIKKINFKQIITAGAIASCVSLIFNSLLFFIFHSVGIISDTVFVQPNEPLTIVHITISSIFPTLVGACVFFLFEKFTNNGFKIFGIVALILMLLSLTSPFMAIKEMPIAYGIVLDVMHIVVALSLLFFIKRAKK